MSPGPDQCCSSTDTEGLPIRNIEVPVVVFAQCCLASWNGAAIATTVGTETSVSRTFETYKINVLARNDEWESVVLTY